MSDWRNQLAIIVNKVKFQLYGQLQDDLEKVSAILRASGNTTGYFVPSEFNNTLNLMGIFLTTQEIRCVSNCFELNSEGAIFFPDFIQALRTSMSDQRVLVVQQAFKSLDTSNQKVLSLETLKQKYNAPRNPRVRCREKKADQVKEEFWQAISAKSLDGETISETGFLDYYADVNAVLPNEREDHFIDQVQSSWDMICPDKDVPGWRQKELEKHLYEKVRQRTVGTDNIGHTLRKKFLYVDQFDEHVADYPQFKQALTELGCYQPDHEVKALFNYYSSNQLRLNYGVMCAYFKDLGVGAEPNLNPGYKEFRKLPESALDYVKKELLSKGYFGIAELRRIFQRADKNGNGALERNEFVWCLKECGINLMKQEYEKLFRYFDNNSDNTISFTEFINTLREGLNSVRSTCVKRCYDTLKQDDKYLQLSKINEVFNPLSHPEIVSGAKTKNDVLREFLLLFGDIPPIGLTFDMWESAFADISCGFDSDQEFENYMNELWQL